MTQLIQPTLIDFDRTYTLEEFLGLNFPNADEEDESGFRYELIGGKIVATANSGISGRHGKIANRLASRLDVFAGELAGADRQKGTVYTGSSAALGLTVNKATWVIPDVCFVLNGRTPDNFDGAIPVVPDIVVEVWSPSDNTRKIKTKIEAYQQARVPLIWSIYMENNYVLVYNLDKPDIKLLNLGDDLDGEPLLPGFKVFVAVLLK